MPFRLDLMAEDVHITPEGLEAVRKEHEELVSVRRPAIASKNNLVSFRSK